MGMLLLEVMAHARVPLSELVDDIQRVAGPTCYARRDIPLKRPVAKAEMVKRLTDDAPATLTGQSITDVSVLDGVKYLLADEGWLLIRPSGTEPVLRVYAEGRSPNQVQALLAYGGEVAS